ncbi:type I polyketide synthase, partial [Thermoflavimicrobium dichotomicum]
MKSMNLQPGIAVIGMACRFPGAKNYEEFWENLKEGRSSIQEIPQERWNWRDYWGDPQTEINKTNSKWGGFIEDVDAFDPGFFGLTNREVENMDPQQRIMLELSWSCLEDAGIPPSSLSGKKVGVFIGVANLDYKELLENDSNSIEAHYASGIAASVIPSRISYLFNFKGPSFPLDTACSSSLNAIHSAIQSIQQGECTMALAGGVSLLFTPHRYISFAKMGILSPTGSCKTFDESADGIVRGEGAGVILLKPLEKALADGDSIYGVIKGSAINHSGKTYTLSYPSPDAQAEVIVEAYKRAGVTPESISYCETHGTGTPKGDPLEFQGLLKAFHSFSSQNGERLKQGVNYCGLGSVKTNIGHLEAAAGIAGVIKVLLSMKYKQLTGLQNFRKLNHRISLEETPFYIVDRLKEWKPLKGGNGEELPRRAGVSSFGFAGTNAHVVIEEAPVTKKSPVKNLPFYMICLSAKTEEAISQKIQDLAEWLDKKEKKNDLANIAATLLLGRDHFDIRCAFVVKDVLELQEKLRQVIENGEAPGYFKDSNLGVKQERPLFEEFGKTLIKELQPSNELGSDEYGQKLCALAQLYVKGFDFEWKMLFPLPPNKIQRVALPTYPFARERYWVQKGETGFGSGKAASVTESYLHPLLHRNTSHLGEQRFSSTFTGQEFFLSDHVVNGKRLLPGVAYLEMARAAVDQAAGVLQEEPMGIRLKNVVWARPIVVDEEPVQVHIGLFPEEKGDIFYEIYSSDHLGREAVIHSQGRAEFCPVSDRTVDLAAWQAACRQNVLTSEQCYESFRAMGLAYGPGHQGLEKVYVGTDQVLAKLSLPASVSGIQGQFVLHPSVMDAALQAAAMAMIGSVKKSLPFALEELEILGGCTSSMWALIRYSQGSKAGDDIHKCDIDVCDEQGNVCVRIKGFSARVMEGTASGEERVTDHGTLMLSPSWKEQEVAPELSAPAYAEHWVILCEQEEGVQKAIEAHMTGVRCIALQAAGRIDQRFQAYVTQV